MCMCSVILYIPAEDASRTPPLPRAGPLRCDRTPLYSCIRAGWPWTPPLAFSPTWRSCRCPARRLRAADERGRPGHGERIRPAAFCPWLKGFTEAGKRRRVPAGSMAPTSTAEGGFTSSRERISWSRRVPSQEGLHASACEARPGSAARAVPLGGGLAYL